MRRLLTIAISAALCWLAVHSVPALGQQRNVPTRGPSGVPTGPSPAAPAPATASTARAGIMPLNLAGANTPVVAGGITTVPQDFGDVEAEADKPTSTNVQYRWDNTTVSLAAGEALTADVQFNTYPPDTKHYHDFRVVYAPTAKGSSSQLIVFAFWPHKVGSTKATITLKVNNIAKYVFNLTGNGIAPVPPASTATCNAPRNTFLPLTRLSVILPGQDLPEGSEQLAQELAWKATQQLGDPLASNIWEASINCFYSTNKALAFFNKVDLQWRIFNDGKCKYWFIQLS